MPNVSSSEIDAALRKALGSYGLDHVELKSGLDHDGERAVFVTAVLRDRTPPIPGSVSASANVAVAEALERVGDDRLSYVYIRRPDDERAPEEQSRAS
jgi:hypothetical protein